jgi:hypothetical protein
MSTNFDEMWADALASFYATTDRKLDDKSLPLIMTLDELKFELSRTEESFTEFRRKKHALVCHQHFPVMFPLLSCRSSVQKARNLTCSV